jgi:S-formylglutathione hydrolase FrmB
MEKNKHTPLPWSTREANEHPKGSKRHEAVIRIGPPETAGNAICVVSMGGEGALYSNKLAVEANAALIVTAVNNHQTLVDALKGLVAEHDFEKPDFHNPAIEQARAALKAVEGGEG